MKHGKKSEQKSVRTEVKKGGKANGRAVAAKKSVATPRASAKSSSKAAAGPTNGKRSSTNHNGHEFTNAEVGSSFQRAVKKYVNAFRRLTD